MNETKLVSPIRVALPRKTMGDKVVSLNLNTYRNNHHAINNYVKKRYASLMLPQVKEAFKGIDVKTPIRIHYKLFVGTRRKLDVSNVVCIVDKCFQDVLVEAGIIEDDNYDYVSGVTYDFGDYEKNQERCEITVIHPIGE